jgi:hypothetical protein
VGRTRKANTKPTGPPASTSFAPNRNRAPSSAQASTLSTQRLAQASTVRPASNRSSSTPQAHCRARPPSTMRGEIARRFSEQAQATARIAAMPNKPR